MTKDKFKEQMFLRVSHITELSMALNSENFSFEKVVELFQSIGWLYINIFKIMKIQPAGIEILGIENRRRKNAKKEKKNFIECVNEIAEYQLWDTKKLENLTFSEDSIVFGSQRSYWRKRSIKDINSLSGALQEYYKEEIIEFVQRYYKKIDANWIHP